MKPRVLLVAFLSLYIVVISPFTSYMKNKPVIEKIGYVPEAGVLKLLSADQHQFVAASLMLTVISYFGGLLEQASNKIDIRPEFPALQKMIEDTVQLDPYNMDAYYFAEAMVWFTGQVSATNRMLEYGMRYRNWDFYLPYFAGFNYGYFLKDYRNAARYYERVGELTGTALPMTLAGRYLYEAGRTDMAISYLSLMAKNARNSAVKKSLQTRLDAFLAVRKIEIAADRFWKNHHRRPRSPEELLREKYLTEIPIDPYGGKFYIDAQGKIRSTSKFAFGVVGRSK